MRRDPQLVLAILRAVQESPGSGELLDLAVPGHPDAEVSEHVRLASEEGLIEAMDLSSFDGECWKPVRLTAAGHQRLEDSEAAKGRGGENPGAPASGGTTLPGPFEYDVAISFAGEQRPEAEAVAAGLTKEDVRVFYDKYETANLWGKDLFEHLADVFQNKAQYCIIFASEAYARKVWPTHERKNAQARALRDKGEYILPVRFDGTEIPGLPATVGYLKFDDHGADGIVKVFLQKIRASRTRPTEQAPSPVPATPSIGLSPAESQILGATGAEGQIWLGEFQMGKYLDFGGKTLPSDLNRYVAAEAAQYLDGLDSLQRRRLARFEGGQLYVLTTEGFRARKDLLAG